MITAFVIRRWWAMMVSMSSLRLHAPGFENCRGKVLQTERAAWKTAGDGKVNLTAGDRKVSLSGHWPSTRSTGIRPHRGGRKKRSTSRRNRFSAKLWYPASSVPRATVAIARASSRISRLRWTMRASPCGNEYAPPCTTRISGQATLSRSICCK